MKNKETLEEAFDRIFDSIDYTEFDFTSFEQGAKWQQEQDLSMVQGYLSANLKNIELLKRSYSEEELIEILDHHTSYLETFIYQYIDKNDIEVNEEWFEQFKKK
jgi:hypothetical protein